ncbi:hypothetical protein RYX45_06315 [Alkalihalophilus pseudofirmus]|uniref:Uncharacterized protein n=1 Tax=Alkalihalophilus pseudofirmus TaxID=79885 RepID=A0AAJ2KU82_ALKPS|nr:hypothetical protein [Alkalihalophilus pseudofirmus]MDV2884784.1 hypothetical protein [Alkalihalophilus pseudofirmus]
MNRQIPATFANNDSDNSLPTNNQQPGPSPQDNPYNVSLSLRLGLIAGIITTIGDALAAYSARLAIDEEISSNFDNLKSQQEQDERFAKLESQMEQLQQQLAKMSDQNKK